MATFTVTDILLENLVNPKPYYNEFLMAFTLSTNSHKVAVDSKGIILDRYGKIADKNGLISHWIHIMAHAPSNFDPIDEITLESEKCRSEIYLHLSSKIVGLKRLITSSRQDLKIYPFKGTHYVDYNGEDIKVYDRDEALVEFRKEHQQNHSGGGDNVGGNKTEYK